LVLPDITVTDSDGSTFTQPSVENVVCTLSPDTSLEVNGTPEGTFAAGSTIEVNITDGVNPVTPDNVTVVGDVVTIEVPKDLTLYAPYEAVDDTISFTIITGSAGTITSADTTGLTSVTYDIDGSPATIPFTLAVGDVLTIDFDAAGAGGVVILSGTYA
jgi:hypothetical protein